MTPRNLIRRVVERAGTLRNVVKAKSAAIALRGRNSAKRQLRSLGRRLEQALPQPLVSFLKRRYFAANSTLNGSGLSADAVNELKYAVQHHQIPWDKLKLEEPSFRRSCVTIVIPVYKNSELTKACLESIYKTTNESLFRIVVVDNGSTDGTSKLLAQYKRKKRNFDYITNAVNLGFSLGCNLGVTKCEDEYILFLNNDTEVIGDWLRPLVDTLRDDALCGAVGPKLLFPDDTLQCGGMAFGAKSKIPYHIYQGAPRSAPWVNRPRRFQAITGACMLMRTSDFIALRGFDITYQNGCEDVDICFRLRLDLGRTVRYNPKSEIYHYEGKTEGRGSHIMPNRRLLVERWRAEIFADDDQFYRDDGFRIVEYHKKGTEPDGETAAYYPALDSIPKDTPAAQQMKVGFCSIWHKRGVSFVTLQLARALECSEIQTHIFARWESTRFSNRNTIFHPRVVNAGDNPSPAQLVNWIKQNDISLYIQVEAHPNDFKRMEAVKKAGVHLMVYEHLELLAAPRLEKYAMADSFLCSTKYTYDFFKQHFPDKPALLLPWGIEQNHTMTANVPNGPIRFLHVGGWGGINNRKNTDLLIRAFVRTNGPAELHVYSQVPLINYGEEVANTARKDPRIIVHEGTVDDISEAYRNKDMLLWPSKREGLGLPIVEALSAGLAVLVSDGYMMKEWIVPGDHGVVCPAFPLPTDRMLPEVRVDEDSLVVLLNQLIRDRQLVERLKENVQRDRELWGWTWQPALFREKVLDFQKSRNFDFSLSDLPEPHLQFYSKRDRLQQQKTFELGNC